jgi:AmiR/NasT family two-component response regulator
MTAAPIRHLRVLVADGHKQNLEHVADVVTRLGHVVIAKESDIATAAALTEEQAIDVAIVVVGESSEDALALIGRIVREATCPVIAVLDVEDPAFIREAAKRGVFAYITDGDAGSDKLESVMEVVLHRFGEYHDLEGAFGRRAITERAKGILMERHAIDEEAAFHLLREHARKNQIKLIDVAQAVLGARALLPDTIEESAR